jgi:hypothetical protein
MLWGRSQMEKEECRVKNGNGPDILHFQFCILHSNRADLLFPVNHAPLKNGVPDPPPLIAT